MKRQDIDIIEALKKEVEIPAVVQQKADAAFLKIHMDAEGNTAVPKYPAGQGHRTKKNKRLPVKRIVILVAALLAFSGISVAAAYLYWSRSLSDGLQITEDQKIVLEKENAVSFAMQECTVNDVTVTAVQSITDNYFTHIIFRVEGYQPAQGMQPDFESVDITVGGETDFNMGGSFYDGLITGPDGSAVYADGSPLDSNPDGTFGRYVMEDRSMEYWVTLSNWSVKGYFINKPVKVELHNLGTVSRAEFSGGLEGTWTFEWNLSGMEYVRKYSLEEALGNTGATVTMAEISPLSFHIEYDFPREQNTENGVDENGNPIETSMYSEPPMLTGFRMKDGSMLTYLGNGGSFGYESEESDTYLATFAMSRMIDVEQIESLLFIKSYPEGGAPLTEENLYIVPVG